MIATASDVRVAVINASYTVLGDTKLKRAMALIIRGEAVIEEFDEKREIRSAGKSFPWPLVIRLLRFVRVPMTYTEATWSKSGVLKRDGFLCAYCAGQADSVDHIIPSSKGGTNTWENTISSCVPCNRAKRDRTPQEAGMPLLMQPTVPMRVYLRAAPKNKKTKRRGR